MERTKVISVVNNTAKAPKNQAFWKSASKAVTRFRVSPVMASSVRLHMSPSYMKAIDFSSVFGKLMAFMI